MSESTSFLLKNRKIRLALMALPTDPLCLRRLGDMPQDPLISPISLRIPRCVLA